MASPPTFIGPYRLVRKLGEGGMGEVYEARHEAIERQVAIKVLRPQYARDADINQRFINEARAVNLINHPGLVQISDFGQLADGSRYIVMEYLRGETLGQRLKRLDGWLPVSQALYITWQVASALVAAHEVGITHRDLKPDNIMLVSDPISPTGERAKLLDFGIARLSTDSVERQSLTGSTILGTPVYMSPEQCRGVGSVGPKSDVYTLGVMLYLLLSARPPFVSTGVGDLINMHISKEPPPLRDLAPDVPAEVATLVHRLLLKNPDLRPAMREVMAELEQLQAQQGAAGVQTAGAPRGSAPYFGISGEKLSDSLAGILGQQIEEEEGLPDGLYAASSPSADGQTLVKGPRPSPPAQDAVGPLSAGHSLGGRGEHLQTRARPISRWSLIPAAVLSGGIMAAATWWLLPARVVVTRTALPSAPSSAAVGLLPLSTVAPPAPAVKQTVSWSLDTLPAGAKVLRADTNQDLGITPWRTEQAKGQGSLIVRLRYPGFAEKAVQLDYSQSSNLQERLTRLPGAHGRPVGHRGIREMRPHIPQVDPQKTKSPDASPKPQFEYVD